MSLHMMFDFLPLLQHLLFPSGMRCPLHRVVVLLSVPGSCRVLWFGGEVSTQTISRSWVWRMALIRSVLLFFNNTNFLQ